MKNLIFSPNFRCAYTLFNINLLFYYQVVGGVCLGISVWQLSDFWNNPPSPPHSTFTMSLWPCDCVITFFMVCQGFHWWFRVNSWGLGKGSVPQYLQYFLRRDPCRWAWMLLSAHWKRSKDIVSTSSVCTFPFMENFTLYEFKSSLVSHRKGKNTAT